MMYAILSTVLASSALALPDCKYFGLEASGGPLIAIDICKSYDLGDGEWGSYQYACAGPILGGGVYIQYYLQKHDCTGAFDYSEHQAMFPQQSCTGGTCDFLTVRNYHRLDHLDDQQCLKDDGVFIEHALVRGCWQNHDESASWNLDCSADSIELAKFDSDDCSGTKLADAQFESGCDWFNFTLPPFMNETLNGTNITMPDMWNMTYHQITECGEGSNSFWAYVAGVGIVLLCCCGCCGMA